jgi:phosphatidylglycerol:prolipoprotein diacylglycerol transferase
MKLWELPHLFVLAGVATTAATARWRARRIGLPARVTIDGLFVMVAAGMVAGHVADVLLYRFAAFRRDWTELLPQSGGWCSLGAIAGGALAGWLWFRRRDHFAAHADTLTVALTLGWTVGRLGCVVSHDHLSAPSASALAALQGGAHDLGLYEALLCAGLSVVVFWLDRRRIREGLLLATAALIFGCGRFALELLRDDPRLAGLTAVQHAMAAMAGYGAWAWLAAASRRFGNRWNRVSKVRPRANFSDLGAPAPGR